MYLEKTFIVYRLLSRDPAYQITKCKNLYFQRTKFYHFLGVCRSEPRCIEFMVINISGHKRFFIIISELIICIIKSRPTLIS